jgi:hypothetical protein
MKEFALVELLEYCMVTESIGGIWKCKLIKYEQVTGWFFSACDIIYILSIHFS